MGPTEAPDHQTKRTAPSRADSSVSTQSRAERLLAEYLRAWGLRDPAAIAQWTRAWVERSGVGEPSATGSQDPLISAYRAGMSAAINDFDSWLQQLARTVVKGEKVPASTVGLTAFELRSLIDNYPQAMFQSEALPRPMLDQLRRADRDVVPSVQHSQMQPQELAVALEPWQWQWWRGLASSSTHAVLNLCGISPWAGSRLLLAILTLVTTLAGAWVFEQAQPADGSVVANIISVGLFMTLFVWIAFSFWMATAGFLRRLRVPREAPQPLGAPKPSSEKLRGRTAILLPIYNESPSRVFAGLRAIYESLQATGHAASFDFFVLSDTTNPDVWLAEEWTWARLIQVFNGPSQVYYRHRTKNTSRKAGNIADFCQRWGAGYDYMIVLDADSVMSGATLVEMARAMDDDPQLGILQAPPVPVNRLSLFARCQQFAARVYGPVFLEGFAWWSHTDGNYYGHNAILRVDAFLKHCRLPILSGSGAMGGEILSHDFVEAALMRRAGYKVRVAQDMQGSYEECPPTLIDFAQRDQRWCQGNMQHLRLIFAGDIHPMSRLHLGMGAMSYLTSPLWMVSILWSCLAFVGCGSWLGFGPATVADAAMVSAPVEQSTAWMWGGGLFAATMALLLLPKLWGYLALVADPTSRAACGGAAKAGCSVLIETVISTLVAPIMMVFHSTFVTCTFMGRKVSWSAQQRDEQGLRFAAALAAHWKQMVGGLVAAVLTFVLAPAIFLWMLPILIGLILAVPLSMLLSSVRVGQALASRRLLSTPDETVVPRVLQRHRHLLALPTPRELADPRGMFFRVLADPAFLALHRSILQSTGDCQSAEPEKLRLAERQLLAGGPARVSVENRKAVLADADALRDLHFFAWTSTRTNSSE